MTKCRDVICKLQVRQLLLTPLVVNIRPSLLMIKNFGNTPGVDQLKDNPVGPQHSFFTTLLHFFLSVFSLCVSVIVLSRSPISCHVSQEIHFFPVGPPFLPQYLRCSIYAAVHEHPTLLLDVCGMFIYIYIYIFFL